MLKKGTTKKAITWAVRVLMLMSFVFIIRKIIDYDIDFSVLASPAIITGLVIASLLFGASNLYSSFVFSWLLNVITKTNIDRKRAVPIFCSSGLYKYLPGNFMHYVGRNRIATEMDGIRHSEVAAATVIDMVFLCIAATTISLTCVFNYAIAYFQQIKIPTYVYIGIFISFCIILFFCIIFRHWFVKYVKNLTNILQRFQPIAAIKLFIACCIRLLTLSTTYFILLMLLGQDVTLAIVPQVIGLFVLSWFIGFITPGAPGGLGIREIIMITFLGGTLPQAVLISSTIIHRVVCILGDLSAYGMAIIYSKMKGEDTNALHKD